MGVFWAGLALKIAVEGNCPTVAAIETEIRALDAELLQRNALARLEPIEDQLRVEVLSDTGSLLVVQDLGLGPSCKTLAAATAVVIVTALTHAQSPSSQADHMPAFQLPVRPARNHQTTVSTPRRVSWEWGLATVLEAAWPRPGGGALGLLEIAPQRADVRRFGVLVQVFGTSPKPQPLPSGSAEYTRLLLSVGPRIRFFAGSWGIDLFASASPAWVLTSGRDLPRTQTSHGFDVGLGGGVRAVAQRSALRPFAMLHAVGFLREQRLVVLGADWEASVPRYGVFVALGLSFAR